MGKAFWLGKSAVLALLGLLLLFGNVMAAPPPDPPPDIYLTEEDSGRTVQLGEDQTLVLRLVSNPSTGYGWQPIQDGQLDGAVLRQAAEAEYEYLDSATSPEDHLLGAPVVEVWRFETLSEGETTLTLEYRRPWETGPAVNIFLVQVEGAGPFTYDKGPAFQPKAEFQTLEVSPQTTDQGLDGLPAAYNACDQGLCSPVKDQGGCGSCWAFSAVGVIESALLGAGESHIYAEQYLLSCNQLGYSCVGGLAPYSHQYHIDTTGLDPLGPGARYEADFPYTASDSTPCGSHTPRQKLASWDFVDDDYDMPTVDQIKNAIYDYGPISASVCAGPQFIAYTDGVFSTNEVSQCSGGTNHAIILTGWDDSQGVWILKNSWSQDWGDDGYMKIKWGISSIGRRANYVVYAGGPPSRPTDLEATGASQTEISLTWNDNSDDETGFKIERSPDGVSDWEEISSPAADATGYTDQGLNCATGYYYRLQAYNANGNSDYSNIANATTSGCPITAPDSLEATPLSPDQVSLTWNDNSDNEDGFRIDRSENGSSTWTTVYTMSANSTAHTDSQLLCETNYHYRVQAYNAGTVSDYSNTDSALTMICPITAPDSLEATPLSPDQVSLTWNDNSDNEDGFRIDRSENGSSTWTTVYTLPANSTAHTDSQLLCETSYHYRVQAYNASTVSDYSNTDSALTLVCPVAAPTDLEVNVVSTTTVGLTWTDNSDNEDGFRIDRSEEGSLAWTTVHTLPADSTAHTDSQLLCETGYHYRVQAYNANTASDYSNTDSAVTPNCPLVAPTNLVVDTVSTTTVSLAWTDNSDNEDGFRIDRSLNRWLDWSTVFTTAANVVAHTDAGLDCETSYFYRVRAYNPGGDSAISNVISATTISCLPPVPPSNLTVEASSPSEIVLTWVDNSDDETGFQIERMGSVGSVADTVGIDWSLIATVDPNVTIFTDTDLQYHTPYTYRVMAFNDIGCSTYCSPAGITTPPGDRNLYIPLILRTW